ncbi:hypothetical protein MHYP_G00201140 [Metynnis hypsauchen]
MISRYVPPIGLTMWKLFMLFGRLQEASLTSNLANCESGKAMVVYLGKQAGQGQARPGAGSPGVPCAPRVTAFSRFKSEGDASATGAGAVLLQDDQKGTDHPVAF